MLAWPSGDEAQAEQLESLADALDAGVTPDALFGVAAGSGGIAAALAARGFCRELIQQEIFAAAESAGRLPPAMRRHAEGLRQRAGLTRELLAALRYPALLVATALFAGGVSRLAFGGSLLAGLLWPLGILAALAGLALLAPAWARHRPLPGLAPLQRLRGELRYLETLHGLYASGVPLLAAHERATAVVTPDWVRLPYARASLRMAPAEAGFVEHLLHAQALPPESGSSLLLAERAGELESALARLIPYRRNTLGRRRARLVRLTAMLVGGLAAAYAIWVILSFYLGYFGGLGALRRGR